MLIAVAATALLLLVADSGPARATYLCASTGSPFGPFDLQAYEAADWRTTYGAALELAGFNALFPELPEFALPPLESGPRSAGPNQLLDPYIPPTLLKAIAWLESSWMQADLDVLYGEVGPVLISPDCGYGIMQITSGMQNISGVPNLEQAMIGGHYAFNIARGARILADKWNMAPEQRPQVGERDPTILEHWYYAVWGYNGFVFNNHPLNPNYPAWPRPPFSCGPLEDGFGHDRSLYPYQEMVFGCMAHPAVFEEEELWSPLEVHLPELSDPTFAEPLSLTNWIPCALDLECAALDIPTPNPFHSDPSTPGLEREEIIGSPVLSVSANDLSFVVPSGSEGPLTSITISNEGTGVLAWRLASSASWLKLSKIQGVSLGSDLGARHESFTVSADMRSLPPGIYNAQITVESLHSQGVPAVINVTLRTPDGFLMEGPDGQLYALQDGLKRLIPDSATFEAYDFSVDDIIPLTEDLLASVPTGYPLPSVLATGRLIQPPGEGAPMYVMDGGAKREIANPEVLSLCSYGADSVVSVSATTVDALPEGPPLTGRPCPRPSFTSGMLLQGSDGWLWVVAGDVRRRVANTNAFIECGYRWGDVSALSDSLIAQLPVGADVYGCSADGSLLLTDDGTVYVVQAGLMRHVPDLATFEAAGFDWAMVLPVGDIELPVGEPLLSVVATGRLIQSDSQGTVYVMDGDTKRRILNPEVFAACGYDWGAVTTLSETTIESIPSGPSVQAPPCPRLSFTTGTLLQDPEGAVWLTFGDTRRLLVDEEAIASCGYESGNINPVPEALLAGLTMGEAVTTCTADGSLLWNRDEVYVVRGGWKRLVPNPATFEAHGFSWEDVVPVPDDWLPTGQPLLDAVATGRLIRSPGEQAPVYVMEAGSKRRITTPDAMAACGYSWDAASVLSAESLAAFPTGIPVDGPPCPKPSFADGTLLVGSGGEIWVIEGGERRWIADPAVFAACGYALANLNSLADSIIDSLPQGPDLAGPPCPG